MGLLSSGTALGPVDSDADSLSSATGWLLLWCGVLTVLCKARYAFVLVALSSGVLATLFFVDPLTIASLGLAGKDPQSIVSLSNRMGLSPVAIPFALQSPLWGYGFLGDTLLVQFTDRLGWLPVNAHNGYLSALLNCGVWCSFFDLWVLEGVSRLGCPRCMRAAFAGWSSCLRSSVAACPRRNGKLYGRIMGWRQAQLLWPFFVALSAMSIPGDTHHRSAVAQGGVARRMAEMNILHVATVGDIRSSGVATAVSEIAELNCGTTTQFTVALP